MSVFLDILYNLGTLVSLSIFAGFIEYSVKRTWLKPIFQGLLFGTGALVGMLQPAVLGPGLIFDGRSILISLAGFYFGPTAAVISAFMAIALRIEQGGLGALTGILVITSSALWGIIFYLKRKIKDRLPSLLNLFIFGFIVHLSMLLLMFTLPQGKALNTLENIAFPVLFLYPLATLAIAHVINIFINRKKTEIDLIHSEQTIRSISNNFQEGMIYQVVVNKDRKRNFTYLSDSVRSLYGISPEEGMTDANLIYSRVLDEDVAHLSQLEETALKTLSIFKAEVRIKDTTGNIRWSSLISTPKQLEDGSICWDGIEFVITQRKLAEEKMLQSLREKETLIRELYHRTKNTMQIISSMLVLQSAEHPSNQELKQLVKDTEFRIQTISMVHQMLYKSQDLSHISIKEYIHDLSFLILQSYEISLDRVSLNIQVEDISFIIDTAIPVGLILNELITNSLKYGFPNNKNGEIFISLRKINDETLMLEFRDNGVGVPDNFDFRNQNTLSSKLIFGIGEQQMKGKVSMQNNNGISFCLEFPSNLHKVRI